MKVAGELIVATLLFCLLPLCTAGAGETFPPDTVFVADGNERFYRQILGSITRATDEYLIIEDSAHVQKLFKRADIGYVGLAPGDSTRTFERFNTEQAVYNYWNRPSNGFEESLKAVTVFGAPVGALIGKAPVPFQRTITALVFLFIAAWFGLKLYDLILVGRETARLNRLKLSLDIAKTKYETLKMSEGDPNGSRLLAAVELPPLIASKNYARVAKDEPRGWLRRLLRRASLLILPLNRRDEQSELYASEIAIRLKRGKGFAARWYRRRLVVMAVGASSFGFYGVMGIILTPIMLIVGLSEPDNELLMLAAVYAVFSVLIIPAWRLTTKRRLLKTAYAKVLSSSDNM